MFLRCLCYLLPCMFHKTLPVVGAVTREAEGHCYMLGTVLGVGIYKMKDGITPESVKGEGPTHFLRCSGLREAEGLWAV